jgi:hypothetical protein
VRHARGEGKKAVSPKRSGVAEGEIEPIDWDGFYRAARTIGLSPSEFWDMTLPEFLLEVNANAPDGNETGKFAGKLKSADIDELLEWMREDEPAPDCR